MSGSYQEHAPAPALRPFVECFWTSRSEPGSEHLVLPDGCADLVFEDSAAGLDASAVGVMSRALPVRDEAPIFRLGVRFKAGGLAPLLRAPLKGL